MVLQAIAAVTAVICEVVLMSLLDEDDSSLEGWQIFAMLPVGRDLHDPNKIPSLMHAIFTVLG